MVGLVAMVVFTGAMALALAAIWSTVASEWRRIARLATGQADRPYQSVVSFPLGDQRIGVRRWSAAPARVQSARARAAA